MSLRTSMFIHLLKRGLLRRGNRPLIAFIALTVASTMTTGMLSLYYGLESKLNRDFRSYGANITIAAAEDRALKDDAVDRARSVLGPESLVVPFAFAIAHAADGGPVVVGGTDMRKVQRLNSWWSVSKWPKSTDEALIGSRAEPHLQIAHGTFDLDFGGRIIHLRSAGTLNTGAEENDRVYLPLDTFEAWTMLKPSLLEVSAAGSREQVNNAVTKLQSAFPELHVRPVRQLLEAQGIIIGRMRSVMLVSTMLISLTVTLCVFATLTSSILERRRDFAVMKAIGSSQWIVNALFAGEALVIGACAALAGYVLGSGLAALISRANFHTVVAPQWNTLPLVLLASMALALLAAMLPLARLQRIEPAGILKGE